MQKYSLVIAADSVERGFNKIQSLLNKKQVVALLDHHPDITIQGDITIINAKYSSVCELVYDFFQFNKIEISRKMATFIMLGLMSDTGSFQHSNTTPKVMEIASQLMKKGAPLSKIVQTSFANKNISTLKLWGKALEKAAASMLQTGMPIVPLRIEGAREVCPPGGSGHFHPGVVSVEAFPPSPVRGSTEAEIPTLMESVYRFLLAGEGAARLPL